MQGRGPNGSDGFCIASETCALDMCKAEYVRDVVSFFFVFLFFFFGTEGFCIASETCALDMCKAEYVRDVVCFFFFFCPFFLVFFISFYSFLCGAPVEQISAWRPK